MPKVKTPGKETRRYLHSWEEQFPWLRQNPDGSQAGFCTVCKTSLIPKKDAILQHSNTTKHIKGEVDRAMTEPITDFFMGGSEEQEEDDEDVKAEFCQRCQMQILQIGHVCDTVEIVPQRKPKTPRKKRERKSSKTQKPNKLETDDVFLTEFSDFLTTVPCGDQQTVDPEGILETYAREETIDIGGNIQETKRSLLHLAVCCCCHTSIGEIDHMGDVLQTIQGSQIQRVPFTKLISNVISPSMEADLAEDLIGKKFTLLMGEASNVNYTETFCLFVRYFSNRTNSIQTEFLGLIPIAFVGSQSIFESMLEKIVAFGLNICNMVGYGTDGSSRLVNGPYSVWTNILEAVPNCTKVQCIGQLLTTCIQQAFEMLPDFLGFLAGETTSWFLNNTLIQEDFHQLHEAMHDPQEVDIYDTKWRLKGNVISKILSHWNELKRYFFAAAGTRRPDVTYKARELFKMYKDDVNKLYFVFLSPIVNEFDALYATFQSKKADTTGLEDLSLLIAGIYQRVYDNNQRELPLAEVKFGSQFATAATKVGEKVTNQNKEFETRVENMKIHCHRFLLELFKQTRDHLPSAKKSLGSGSIASLHPRIVLSKAQRAKFSNLPMKHLLQDLSPQISFQYDELMSVEWEDEFKENGIPQGTEEFWVGVLQYYDTQGKQIFKDLAMYALSCLTLPVSRDSMEKSFSLVKSLKTDYFDLKLVEAVYRVRLQYQNDKECCRKFIPSQKRMDLLNKS